MVNPLIIMMTACIVVIQLIFINCKGPFTLDPRSEFNAHQMRIRHVHTWIRFGRCAFDAHQVNPPQEVDWNQIATEFIVYSSNNDKSRTVTPPWTATLSKLSRLGRHTRCIRRPRYELWWPIMAYHAGTLLTRCCRKIDRLSSGLV